MALEQTVQQLVHARVLAQHVVVDHAGHAGGEAGRVDRVGLARLLGSAEHQPRRQPRDAGQLYDSRRQALYVAVQRAQAPAGGVRILHAQHRLVILQRPRELAAADAGDGDQERNRQIRHPQRRAVGMPEPVPDGGAQVQPQRAGQAVDRRLRREAEDLPVGKIL